MLLETAFAQAPGASGQDPTTSLLMNVLPFVLIIGVFYFLMIRPQQKRQKETKKMLDAMKKGDKVLTSSGIHGTISEIQDNIVVLQVAENTRIRFEKVAVTNVLKD
ncbi:preprotein translocase subunit YajC [Ignavibacteria bacterium]|nr:preprotein translocase subunit YajC [Bacteroidota bacterium]MCZ2132800.1 preprotein translocase subunit YajC [Bacteroidota bacterium]